MISDLCQPLQRAVRNLNRTAWRRCALFALLWMLTLSAGIAWGADDVLLFPVVVHPQTTTTSYLSIPYTAFVGTQNATGAILLTGACWNDNSTILLYLGAPVFLPHGAVVKELQVNYYKYYAGDEASMTLYRVSNTSQHTTMATLTCNDAGGARSPQPP